MTREAEAAFKAWRVNAHSHMGPQDYFAAGHAAADTDATRKFARMAALVDALGISRSLTESTDDAINRALEA